MPLPADDRGLESTKGKKKLDGVFAVTSARGVGGGYWPRIGEAGRKERKVPRIVPRIRELAGLVPLLTVSLRSSDYFRESPIDLQGAAPPLNSSPREERKRERESRSSARFARSNNGQSSNGIFRFPENEVGNTKVRSGLGGAPCRDTAIVLSAGRRCLSFAKKQVLLRQISISLCLASSLFFFPSLSRSLRNALHSEPDKQPRRALPEADYELLYLPLARVGGSQRTTMRKEGRRKIQPDRAIV